MKRRKIPYQQIVVNPGMMTPRKSKRSSTSAKIPKVSAKLLNTQQNIRTRRNLKYFQTPISNNSILFNNYGNFSYMTKKIFHTIYIIRLMAIKVTIISIVTIIT